MPAVPVSGVVGGNNFANAQRTINAFPDECPICHRNIVPDRIGAGFEFGSRLEIYFRCTNGKCRRSFISIYSPRVNGYELINSFPALPIPKRVSAEIEGLSSSFVRIWGQAQQAEAEGLEDIAGPGYRKALEFLIKDYAISLQTDDKAKEEIRKIQLGSVITKYLNGDKLPIVSKRAAWLGNDETHYEKRWIGKDLQDLKRLIDATEHFIAMEKLVESLPAEMPDPKTAAL